MSKEYPASVVVQAAVYDLLSEPDAVRRQARARRAAAAQARRKARKARASQRLYWISAATSEVDDAS